MTISLQDEPRFVEIILSDDGIGFNENKHKSGSGLMSMKKRANLIQTDLDVNTIIGEGTTITIKYNKN